MDLDRKTRDTAAPRSQATLLSIRTLRMAAVAAMYLSSASVAFANEGGHHHEPTIGQIFHLWINFALYAALLVVLLRPVVVAAWAARREYIKGLVRRSASDLEEAEKDLKAAEDLSRTVLQAQANAETEIRNQAKIEADAILTAAKEKVARIAGQADDLIAAEGNAAQSTLKQELVEKALEVAKARFLSGDLAARQTSYTDAAISSARRLVQ